MGDTVALNKFDAETKEDDAPQQFGSSSTLTKMGQKYATPSPGNGDRVFYESLLAQRPDSEMAQEWCVNYGILPEEEAKKMYAMVHARKVGKPSPMVSKKSHANGSGHQKKPKILEATDGEGLGKVNSWERATSMAL
jgi:hypothetical protein